jgi:arylsulfatase A-like enzyme
MALRMLKLVPLLATGLLAQVLPPPEPRYQGEIGRTAKDSKPSFPARTLPPKDAPNVLLVLLDDVGYGQVSTYGGPVPTPAIEKLAQSGLRYTQFHTTALCSPTRAALLAGRNHHRMSFGVISEYATGFPGYQSIWPRSAASVAEVLRLNGYATAAFGKWHNTPISEAGPTGPFDRWPTGLGFEYFYGFQGGDTSQWDPGLVENTRRIAKPPQAGYHFTTDMVDHAIGWLKTQRGVDPSRPFFLYVAPGAAHAPHHVPKEWIEKFEGKFDHGWDAERARTFARQKQLGVVPPAAELTPRPAELAAWDSLPADQRKLFARMMEVYAGFLAQTDYEIGRLVETIGGLGELDNTLVIYIVGDNGASAEGGLIGRLNENAYFNRVPEDIQEEIRRMDELGGPTVFNHYPAGWAWAGTSPFPWMKQVASHLGGIRNPLIVSWPKRITDRGGVRPQFHHVIDVMPTILEAAGVATPRSVQGVEQMPLDGKSMLYSFADAKASSTRRTQYFEMFGNRAIYQDGWMASTMRRIPWIPTPLTPDMDDVKWELYHLTEDYSQSKDVAAQYPQRLKQLQDAFLAEAARNEVLPLDDRPSERFDLASRPGPAQGRKSFTYLPGTTGLPEGVAPDLRNRSFSITAEVEIPAGGAQGVLATQGGRFGGWALLLDQGRPVFVYNMVDKWRYTIAGSRPLPPGAAAIRFDFTSNGGRGAGGAGRLFVNGAPVAEGAIERTMPNFVSFYETFDVGEDTGTPVAESYRVPNRFTGTLRRLIIEPR